MKITVLFPDLLIDRVWIGAKVGIPTGKSLVQECAKYVQLEKCCTTNVYWQNSASILLRTSPPKFDICLQMFVCNRFVKMLLPGPRKNAKKSRMIFKLLV